ncbi:hypothetical protein Bca4012_057394 [Brassica carinata]
MLEQPSLPEWKRLPLALIALVDGLLVCGHKLLRLTPAYVEMLEDTGYFLQYPWGREAFVSTISRLTPPQPSDPFKMDRSLSVMRIRLKQQSTACYGFPLALQLFAFKAIPSLLEKILEPNKTTTFLEEPEGCDSTNTLLNFEDILLMETQAEVIVTYSIPDEGGDPKWEKEVIDPRIDNLVRGMREGHEFKATDFRGGDSSLPPLKPAEKGEGVGVKKKCLKPSRRFGKASDEPGCSTQTPQRPIRPRRGIRKQSEPGNLSDKEEELKEWIRVELKTQLGKLRDHFLTGCIMIGETRSRFRKTQQTVKQTETTVMLTLPAWKFQRSDVRTVVMVLMKLKNVGLIVRNTRRTTAMGLARMRR